MRRRTALSALGVLSTGAAIAAGALPTTPAAAAVPALDAFGIVGGTQLVVLSTTGSATSPSRPISGLQEGERVLGIDVRPTTGQLFALGSSSRLYVVSPFTARATAVGGPFTPALDGTSFGFDFNPTVDRIRVTSDTGQNLRLNPVTGGVAAVDGRINPPTDIEGAAYTSSAGTATSTTLYDLSATTGQLYIQNPPNAGTIVPVGPTGLVGLSDQIGFDIVTSGGTDKGVASVVVNGAPQLHEINLATGTATFLRSIPALTAFALAGPSGYCGASADGAVGCVGGAGGARPAVRGLAADVVDAAQTPSGQGVWQVALDGGVITSGDAGFFGAAASLDLQEPVVAIAPTPSGKGYWLLGGDGGVFAYGDAGFFGSVPGSLRAGETLRAPVVGIVGTGTGRGYWIVAADGGIFSYGDAPFLGSVPQSIPAGQSLQAPVIAIARNETGGGYYAVSTDGGVFAFGAPFLGSAGDLELQAPITDIASAGPTGGYRLFGADGGVFTYGGAGFAGAVPGLTFGVGLAG